MGIAERKLREKSQRRKAILKAAKRLILKHGVEGMSMNQLARATELNKATLYLYFSEKDDLVDAVAYEGLLLLEKAFQEVNRFALRGFEKVSRLVHTTFSFYGQYPVYFHAFNHQERRRPSERLETPFAVKGNEVASRIFDRIAEGIRQGIDDGSIRKEIDINVLLVLLYAQIYGVMHTVHSKKDIYEDVFGLAPAIIEESALEIIEYYLRTGERAQGKEQVIP